MRTGALEHSLAEVGRDHICAELAHPPRELAVPARDFEDAIPGLDPEESFDSRLYQVSLPGEPSFHPLVPERSEIIPRLPDIVVQTGFLTHVAKRSVRRNGRGRRSLSEQCYLRTWHDMLVIGAGVRLILV